MRRTVGRLWAHAFQAALLILGLFAAAQAAPSASDGTVRVGDMAPDFTLQALDGTSLTLSHHLGKRPVLLVFWSYFCFPCQRELPDLQQFAGETGSKEVDIIGICLDGPQYSDRLLPFAKQNSITFPLLYDKETLDYFEVAERYGVVGTPTSFLLDPAGRVRLIHLGRLDRQLLTAAVKSSKEQAYCAELTKP